MQNVFDQKVQSAGLGADDQKSMVRSAPLPNDRLYNRVIVDTEIYNVSQNGRAN